MSSVGPGLLFGLIAGTLAGCLVTPIVLALLAYRLPRRRCPLCSAPVPRISRPRNLEQTLWGGRTCQNCGHAIPPVYASWR